MPFNGMPLNGTMAIWNHRKQHERNSFSLLTFQQGGPGGQPAQGRHMESSVMIRATPIHPRPSERDLMIPMLLLTRAAIIGWTTMAVLPLEIAFDLIESELERSGVAP
jgi:hypothetical protein